MERECSFLCFLLNYKIYILHSIQNACWKNKHPVLVMFYQLNSHFTYTYCVSTWSAGCFCKIGRSPPSSVEEKAQFPSRRAFYLLLMFSIIEGHFIMYMPLLFIKVLSSAVKPRNHLSNFGSVRSRYSLAKTSSNSDLQYKMHNCLPQSNKAQWYFKLYWFKVQFLNFDLMQAHWFVWVKECLWNVLLKV